MSKCPCKIQKRYFVCINDVWWNCDKALFNDLIESLPLCSTEPFEEKHDGVLLIDFDFCRSAICRIYYFSDIVHGLMRPYCAVVDCYIDK